MVLVEHLLHDVGACILRLVGWLVITVFRLRFEQSTLVPHLLLLFGPDGLDRLLPALSWFAATLHFELFEFIDAVFPLVRLHRRRMVVVGSDWLRRQTLLLLVRLGRHRSLVLLIRDGRRFAAPRPQESFSDFWFGLLLVARKLVSLRVEGVLLLLF